MTSLLLTSVDIAGNETDTAFYDVIAIESIDMAGSETKDCCSDVIDMDKCRHGRKRDERLLF